ncbi:MAG: KpsF/GutQ family sugar-phosphate isomerase [Candidatus Rokubacteria bacterium]|nr:KpsF/GutQ family sugar-phosphate isomerase [Candidatus Rokubacteria bacterium]
MESGADPLKSAERVLRIEAEAVASLMDRLGEPFLGALEILKTCRGRVVVTGIGKSGLVGRKIAATLASTGTLALFLHPAEGAHGDLGMVARGDVLLVLSNSGETDEILGILPAIKRLGVPLLVMTGNTQSTLARHGDVVLDVSVKEEACPMNLTPTASTTATLAMGDALAVALLELRGLCEEDFALLHPGGILGRRLLLRVEDLMHIADAVPVVPETAEMQQVILEMTGKRFGATSVVDGKGALTGIITDGDLRRHLQKDGRLFEKRARDVMTPRPKTISGDELATKALELMEHHAITSLLIVDATGRPTGIVHLHDLLRAKIA